MSKHRRREKKLYLAFLEILKNWWWILILAIAAFAVFTVYSALHSEDTAKATLVLRYEKAYEGLSPNGSRFNINDLLNDEVLTKAINLAGLDGKLTTSQLQKSISLDSSGSQNPKNKYIATEYTVILSNKYLPDTISSRSMLGIVMECYKTYFLEHYGRNDGVLDIDWSETEVWEYLEFADIMGVKFNIPVSGGLDCSFQGHQPEQVHRIRDQQQSFPQCGELQGQDELQTFPRESGFRQEHRALPHISGFSGDV